MGLVVSVPVLVALLVCLMPTTIGGLLPAIGIAGMDRLLPHNVIALSGRAVEASGRRGRRSDGQDRHHHSGQQDGHEFIPAEGVTKEELAERHALFPGGRDS